MARKHVPLAICYDFDGTLSPGYMQNYDFIPKIGMKTGDFWDEVKKLAKDQHGDEILIYMGHMLRKADQAGVSVKRKAIKKYGEGIELFEGVEGWFDRVNEYGRSRGVAVEHFIISSGLREMIRGTKIGKHFTEVFASGFWYDHEGVARFPALGVNYTTKTQYLFRINKGSLDVWDKDKVNSYVPPDRTPSAVQEHRVLRRRRDGYSLLPALIKDQGGHSIRSFISPAPKRAGRESPKN